MKIVARNRITTDTRKQYDGKNEAYIMWLYHNSPDQLKSGFLGTFCLHHENGGDVALLRSINIAVTEKELVHFVSQTHRWNILFILNI